MNITKLRTAFLAASVVVLCAIAPTAGADPVDVQVDSTPGCIDTDLGEGCDVPFEVPGVCVYGAGTNVGVLSDCA